VPPVGAVTITRQAQNMGKPAIAVEAGRAGAVTSEDVDVLVTGSLNVMRHLKMLPGAAPPVEHAVWIENPNVVKAEGEGVFFPVVGPEAYVTKGMRVGYVTDYFGEKISDIAAPVSGVVIYIRAIPSLKKGDNVADIGEIAVNP
jgi:uncharacterized protein